MGAYVQIVQINCDMAISAGSSGGVSFEAFNTGDSEATSVPITVTTQDPGGSTVDSQTTDPGPIPAGEQRHVSLVIPGGGFNQSGTYTVHVAAAGGGNASCSFTVG